MGQLRQQKTTTHNWKIFPFQAVVSSAQPVVSDEIATTVKTYARVVAVKLW